MLSDIYHLGTATSTLKVVEGASGPLVEWTGEQLLLRGKPCTILEAWSAANTFKVFYSEIVELAKVEMLKQERIENRRKSRFGSL